MSVFPFIRGRLLVPLLVVGVALVVAAACGDDGGGDQAPATQGMSPAGETPAADGAATGGQTTAEIKMVPTIKFDKTELTIDADTEVTITVDNTDTGIAHNFAVYTSREAAESGEEALAATEICNGPCTETATLNLSAGQYFFRCQVHPGVMTGTLIAQ